jgi:NADPH-dependent curcumin reductase CurA
MTTPTYREVQLVARPHGALTDDVFRIAELPIPEPAPGQVLVRNTVMAVAAVMRMLMNDVNFPGARFQAYELGTPPNGPAVGEVVAAPGTDLAPGDLVTHRQGWREYSLVAADEARKLEPGALPDPAACLAQGATAWMGVVRGAEVSEGDTVFVSGAAGGVGSLAGQAARLRGAARLIGSTSSKAKADYLTSELGYDAVVLRGAAPIEEQLRAAAPDGIDAMIDNVGGEQLEAAIAVARRRARIALVGALSTQLSDTSPRKTEIDTLSLLSRGITLRGVALFDHFDIVPEWYRLFAAGLRDGTLKFPHARLKGIDQAPRALRELIEGRHIGAVLVEL